MDIVEGLLALGSVTVDCMISTSKRYSKDEHFTAEGREYYSELSDALTMAKGNLDEYKKKRDSSKFSRLNSSATQNSKLNSMSSSANKFKVYTLVDAYFGAYRKKRGFYFFDNESSRIHDKIKQYITYPYGAGKKQYNLNPIFAISSFDERSRGDAFAENTVVFCEEGLAFNFNGGYFEVLPYENVKQVKKAIKKQMFILEECYVFLVNTTGGFSSNYVLDQCFPPAAHITMFNTNERSAIAHIIYDFIHCFNSECQFIDS